MKSSIAYFNKKERVLLSLPVTEISYKGVFLTEMLKYNYYLIVLLFEITFYIINLAPDRAFSS